MNIVYIESDKLCMCGCNKYPYIRVYNSKIIRKPNFLHGHNNTNKKIHSVEFIEKFKQRNIGNKYALGVKRNLEFKENLRKLKLGKKLPIEYIIKAQNTKRSRIYKKVVRFPLSEDTKNKISKTLKNKYKSGILIHKNLGKKFTKEEKLKYSIAHKKGNIEQSKINIKKACEKIKILYKNENWLNTVGREKNKKISNSRKHLKLPKKFTFIEIKIISFLNNLKMFFITHKYMKILHDYQCDIFIPSLNLVIECDGNYWHNYPVGNEIDYIRTHELIWSNYKVLRLWESDIKKLSINEFKELIK